MQHFNNNEIMFDQTFLNDIQLDLGMQDETEISMRGRNSRRPKKANHGARPCSSVMRNLKKKGWYQKIREGGGE